MRAYKEIQEKGAQAYRDGRPISDNPYAYASRKFLQRRAAWDAGYLREKKKHAAP